MIANTAGKRGTGNGTAVTERPYRENVNLQLARQNDRYMDLAVRLAIPGAIEGVLRGPMREWDRTYLMDLVHLLEKR
jgi:hypothetical protein